jgi:hypothetical protein
VAPVLLVLARTDDTAVTLWPDDPYCGDDF